MTNQVLIFAGSVFAAVFILMIGITVPVFGERKQIEKRLRRRIGHISKHNQHDSPQSLLRQKYLRKLSPIERQLESLPVIEQLSILIEQAGHKELGYRFILYSLLIATIIAGVVWYLFNIIWVAALVWVVLFVLPFFKLNYDRHKRIEAFEELLPEALDLMTHSLQAGHPFNECVQIVSDEFPDPVGKEFALTYSDLNYGNDLRWALLGLLERIPSITLVAFVTSILIQKETGGNLAEVLKNISAVIRGRFRFHRKVKTLSAEGRLSAWILTLVPFALFAVIWATTPGYIAVLWENPTGIKLVMYGLGGIVLGVLWMRKLLNIEV